MQGLEYISCQNCNRVTPRAILRAKLLAMALVPLEEEAGVGPAAAAQAALEEAADAAGVPGNVQRQKLKILCKETLQKQTFRLARDAFFHRAADRDGYRKLKAAHNDYCVATSPW